METLAAASYGEKAGTKIFKPLIEKWCRAPLSSLDSRYFASRMHSKLQMDSVADYSRLTYSQVERAVSDLWGGNQTTCVALRSGRHSGRRRIFRPYWSANSP